MASAQNLDLLRLEEQLESFATDWKALKLLVDGCFRENRVTEEDEVAFRDHKDRLQRLYPAIRPHLQTGSLGWSGAGRNIHLGEPITNILSTTPHISYLLQDSQLWGGLPKEAFDNCWEAGMNKVNGALGHVQGQLDSLGDVHVEEYVRLKRWVDRLAGVRRAWERLVSRPIRMATMPIRRPLTLVVESIERNSLYKVLVIISTLGGAAAVIYLMYLWLK